MVRRWARITSMTDYILTPDHTDKLREDSARKRLARRGMKLHKSRTRNPRAVDYGLYMISENGIALYADYVLDLDAVFAIAWAAPEEV